MESELELQRGHVPAGEPPAERPRSEPMSRETAERSPRLRPRDAVDADPGMPLQPANRARGGGAANAVDRAGVEPVGAERDL